VMFLCQFVGVNIGTDLTLCDFFMSLFVHILISCVFRHFVWAIFLAWQDVMY